MNRTHPFFETNKKIVFLGDSITQGGDYVADVECFLLALGIQPQIISVGLSSESSTDLTEAENAGHLSRHGFGHPLLSQRLQRTLECAKPDLLFSCYGMNDCGALPYEKKSVERFIEAQETIEQMARQTGVGKLIFLTPPVRENLDPNTASIAPQNLESFVKALLALKNKTVIDLFGPMKSSLLEKRKSNPLFVYSPDGVHPNREGHFLMAKNILSYFFHLPFKSFGSAEDFFRRNGEKIRQLVVERKNRLTAAYLTEIGHTRPTTPGGPDGVKGLPLEEAHEQSKKIAEQIQSLLSS